MEMPQTSSPPVRADMDDEINLLDLLLVLLKWKWLIFALVFFSGVAAVVISLLMTNIYRSEATLVPRQEEQTTASPAMSALRGLGGIAGDLIPMGAGGSTDKFEKLLKSRALSTLIVEKYNLMPIIFDEGWDPKTKKWLTDPEPTIQDAYKSLMGMLTISKDRKTDFLSIQFNNKDPKFAKEMVDRYIIELSETLRQETLKDAEENQRFLHEQLERTSDVLLKEKVYALLAKEIEKETFARAQQPYSFQVLDPPVVSDLNKKVKPKRAMICILSVMVALFVSVFLAFFLEYVSRIKREAPERYSQIKNAFRLRSKGKHTPTMPSVTS